MVRLGRCVLLATLLMAATMAAPAEAAFPGANGKIAFSAFLEGGNEEIHVANPDLSGLTRLTYHLASDRSPVWSPDGTRIAFVSNRDGNDELYVMNADGTNPTRLTDEPAADRDPSWSPDGRHIVFTSDRDNENLVNPLTSRWEIYVTGADGTGLTRLTYNATYEVEPAWSPDGTRIAFVGVGGIRAMDPDGTNQVNLTDIPAQIPVSAWSPEWSPDGERIAFLVHGAEPRRPGRVTELYVMDRDGANMGVLYSAYPYDVTSFAWAPNGGLLVSTNLGVVYQPPDGSPPMTLTGLGGADPNWQPLPSRPSAPVAPACDNPTVVGTPGDDALVGTSDPDVIDALGGDDVIKGLAGDDVICGGDGLDRISGGPGDDRISGRDGRDRISGNSGHDQLIGGGGDDVIRGNDGSDLLSGDAGADRLDGGPEDVALDDNDGGPGTGTDASTSCEVKTNVP